VYDRPAVLKERGNLKPQPMVSKNWGGFYNSITGLINLKINSITIDNRAYVVGLTLSTLSTMHQHSSMHAHTHTSKFYVTRGKSLLFQIS